MKYYATVAASSSVVQSQDTVERIERRVLDSNPIMEAFGKKAECCCDITTAESHSNPLLSVQAMPVRYGTTTAAALESTSSFS